MKVMELYQRRHGLETAAHALEKATHISTRRGDGNSTGHTKDQTSGYVERRARKRSQRQRSYAAMTLYLSCTIQFTLHLLSASSTNNVAR